MGGSVVWLVFGLWCWLFLVVWLVFGFSYFPAFWGFGVCLVFVYSMLRFLVVLLCDCLGCVVLLLVAVCDAFGLVLL